MLDTRARYERNKRNAEKRILERGYIWLWPEFSRVNLTRPVLLVSSSPRNRINREPLLRQRFFLSLSLFLPSLLSFFLSHGSLKKYPRIISFRTRYLPLMLGSPSHPPTLLPFKPRSNEQFSRGKDDERASDYLVSTYPPQL